MLLSKLYPLINRHLSRLFLFISLPMVLFFALVVPPFQVPDESAHLYRADQLSHGDLIGSKLNDESSGGFVDSAYIQLFHTYLKQVRPTSDMRQEAEAIPLTDKREYASFVYTVLYGPFMYAPQTLALAIGRTTSMSALHAFYLARCLNGLVAVLLGFLALQIARRGRFILFTMLTMPMALSLMGSLSQDALLLTSSAFFLALSSRAITLKSILSIAHLIGLMALLTAIAWGRLPYIVLGVCFLWEPLSCVKYKEKIWRQWPGILALISALTLTVLWGKVLSPLQARAVPMASASEQSTFLLSHLALVPEIALKTFHYYGAPFIGEFFGVLGLLTVWLPKFFYYVGFLGLITALTLEMVQDWPLQKTQRALVLLALLAGSSVVFLALYLTYTPVGEPVVQGVQGRYFIPFIIASSFILPVGSRKLKGFIYPLIVALPLVSIVGVIFSAIKVIHFYYG